MGSSGSRPAAPDDAAQSSKRSKKSKESILVPFLRSMSCGASSSHRSDVSSFFLSFVSASLIIVLQLLQTLKPAVLKFVVAFFLWEIFLFVFCFCSFALPGMYIYLHLHRAPVGLTAYKGFESFYEGKMIACFCHQSVLIQHTHLLIRWNNQTSVKTEKPPWLQA